MTALAIIDLDGLPMCFTCGFQPDFDRGLIVNDDDGWTGNGHTDSAHEPNWMLDPGSPFALVDVATLKPGDQLGTGETVAEVRHAPRDYEDWANGEDGQTVIDTDQRTGLKAGWPGGSKIVIRKPTTTAGTAQEAP